MIGLVGLLRDEAVRIKAIVGSSRWYIFGSILKAKLPISDVDLLVICETSEDCDAVRFELRDACSQYPIHLLLMTSMEEKEVGFADGQGAIPLSCMVQSTDLPRDGNVPA